MNERGVRKAMMKGLKNWRLFALMTALLVFLAGCGREEISTLIPAGKVAQDQFNLLILSTIVMTFVIIVVSIIFVLAIVKFRRSKLGDDMIPEQVDGSAKLEFIWTAVPIVLLLILAVPTVYSTFDLADVTAMDSVNEEGEQNNLTVNVTAKLYWWEFEYPEQGIVTAQELVVPTDERVYFNLISADIKHSFWIPSVGGKLDVNPENVNKFYLEFDKASSELEDGVFYGKCAELCGPSHALMDFKVKSVEREEFDQWVAAMQEEPEPAAEALRGEHARARPGPARDGRQQRSRGRRTHGRAPRPGRRRAALQLADNRTRSRYHHHHARPGPIRWADQLTFGDLH